MRKVIRTNVDLSGKETGNVYPFKTEHKLGDNIIISNVVLYNTEKIKIDSKEDVYFYIGGTNKLYKEDIEPWCGPTSNNPGPVTSELINFSQINYYGKEPLGGFGPNNYLGFQIKNIANQQWATQIVGSHKIVYSCNDPQGIYIYLVGTYDSDIYFYNRPGNVYTNITFPNPHGLERTFIAKYDTEGELIWANYLISSVVVEGTNIVCDRHGNLYISGTYIGNLSIYNIDGNISSVDIPDVLEEHTFVFQYSPDGNPIWGTRMGPCIAISMCCNVYDELYVAGYFVNSEMKIYNNSGTHFENSLPNESGISSFITKFGSDGYLNWCSRIDGLENKITDICGDSDGSLYLTGYYSSNLQGNVLKFYNQSGQNINYSDISLSINGTSASFIVKFNKMGHVLWANKLDGYSSSESGITSCIVDNENNLYVTGNYENNLFIYKDNQIKTSISNFGFRDVFIIKYDKEGNYIWNTGITGTSNKYTYSITCDNKNNPYICGVEEKNNDSFVMKFNSHGIGQWYSTINSLGNCAAMSVSTDNNNNLYVLGWYDTEKIQVYRNGGTFEMTNPRYETDNSGFIVKYITESQNRVKIKKGNLYVLMEVEVFRGF